jgi:lipopolysaccharide/colanic/teichoic acid biosynthesis glycosyltransferase
MSIVGPRPVIPELTVEFRSQYEQLLKVRPGLTDPAAIKYCREAEFFAGIPEPFRYFKAVVTPDKLRISIEYLARADVMSDFGVMLKTAMVLYVADTWPRSRSRSDAQVAKPVNGDEESTERYIAIVANRVA